MLHCRHGAACGSARASHRSSLQVPRTVAPCAVAPCSSSPSSSSSSRVKPRQQVLVRSTAPQPDTEEARSPLDAPQEWEAPQPSKRPDIFPEFEKMERVFLPKPLPGDPEVPDEEAEEAVKRTEPGDPDPEAPPGEPSEPEPGEPGGDPESPNIPSIPE